MPDRKRAMALGRRAEQAVAAYLISRDYDLIGRNVRVGHLEVDILARKGSVVAIVEVRYRGPTAWQSPFESIGPNKQRRLMRAAERLWDEQFDADPTIDRIRLDVAAVDFPPGKPAVIEYVEGID